MTKYTCKHKNINNKAILSKINVIEDAFKDFGVDWYSRDHRMYAVEFVEEYMEELMENNSITQYNVICDKRNNPPTENKNGRFYFDVMFRQTNCLNVSKLHYIIDQDIKLDDTELSFDIIF